jgi:hypothetical protein
VDPDDPVEEPESKERELNPYHTVKEPYKEITAK